MSTVTVTVINQADQEIDVELDLTISPAGGDGWNEPRYDASVDDITMNGQPIPDWMDAQLDDADLLQLVADEAESDYWDRGDYEYEQRRAV